MQDLKAGYLLGATPWKQQVMQGIGVISAVLVMAPVLNLLLVAYGIGPASETQPNSLSAPQATLMASVADGVLGGELPWGLISIGALIGGAIILIDLALEARGSAVRAPVLAVAVGLYLPLELSVPIFLGGLIAWLAEKYWQVKTGSGPGILFAAGLITGEALLGIVMAIPIVISGDPAVLAATDAWKSGPITGLLIFSGVIFSLLYIARQKPPE
jgi:putative OPT family oligopeptide transporter